MNECSHQVTVHQCLLSESLVPHGHTCCHAAAHGWDGDGHFSAGPPAWTCLGLMACFLICDSFIKSPPFRIFTEPCNNLLIELVSVPRVSSAFCWAAPAARGHLGRQKQDEADSDTLRGVPHPSGGARRAQEVDWKALEVGGLISHLSLQPRSRSHSWTLRFLLSHEVKLKETFTRCLIYARFRRLQVMATVESEAPSASPTPWAVSLGSCRGCGT